ncbi:uncharacterized protein (DUF736 family) [Xanthomonas campestris]|nr:uncharacterized protein (DUF736 family) [Xanthomonas campestris]
MDRCGHRTLTTLNVKVKLVPNDKGENESAPDFRLQAADHDFGAAWKKTSEAGRDYLSVAIDDPSFPATVYARLIEGENGAHDLIGSRSKPRAARRPPIAPRPLRRGAVLLIAAPPAQGSGSCLMPGMSRAGIASVMVECSEAGGSRNSMACGRVAPPGFRAVPRADFAVSAGPAPAAMDGALADSAAIGQGCWQALILGQPL